MKKIAVIGAGLAGLTLANELRDTADIHVFEKARGVGGRMSTRYADPYQFDHGAQYFTARETAFKDFLAPLIEKNVIAPWTPKVVTLEKEQKPYKREWFEPHYVAVPKMNALCKALAEDLDVRTKTRLSRLERNYPQWRLFADDENLGLYDWVISSAPAAQTAELFPDDFKGQDRLRGVSMTGCYTLMLGFEGAPKINWQAAVVKNSPLSWMALNSHKPGRDTGWSLVAHSSNTWAESHIDDHIPDMQDVLLKELSDLTSIDVAKAAHISTHRWRYADTKTPAGKPYLIDPELGLAACGDWCIAGRVEAAFMSGHALSAALKEAL